MSNSAAPWLVVAGGGTAGHVLPALAVADTLVSEGVNASDIVFIGSERGVEKRLVTEAGYQLTLLPGRGLLRSFAPKAIVANLRSAFGLTAATVSTVKTFARARPAVVLSVGGYASVSACIAARITRVPLVLAESNARAGRSVKAFTRYAKAAAVAFDGTGLERAELTGNPVRREILELANQDPGAARSHARSELGVDPAVLLVTIFGGSLGARRINDAVLGACELWSESPPHLGLSLMIRHVVGERDLVVAQERRNAWLASHPEGDVVYQQVAYENRMPLWYAASDLVVCRAGATSVADLAVAGLPAILIPLPSAAEDHQTANAQAVADDGAGVLLADRDVTAERLRSEIEGLLSDRARMSSMATAQRRRARPDAGHAIARLLRQFATRPPAAPSSPAEPSTTSP